MARHPLLTGLRRNRIAANPFSPLSLSPVLWLDSSDSTTVFQDSALTTAATADGDPVGGLKDLSGNARHITQATSSKRATLKLSIQNGLPAIRFDGVDDILSLAALAVDIRSVFLVAAFGAGASKYALEFAATQNAIIKNFSGGLVEYYGATPRTSMGLSDTGVCVLYEYVFSSATDITTYKNGTLVATDSGTPTAPDRFNLGGSALGANVDMDVMEFICYSSTLSTANRNLVEAYLNAKWAIY